jgi:hypothetical protein
MRAPVQSFKSELAAFRASATSPRGSAVAEVLDRWGADERAEEVWQEVHRHAPGLAAGELIKQVLVARWGAVASVNRIFGVADEQSGRPPILRGFNAEWDDLVPMLKKRLNRKLSGAPLALDVAAAFEEAASEIRQLHSHYFGYADQVNFPLKRQGTNEDRAVAAFCELMTGFFQERCQRGLKLPGVVAFLAEVVFPGKEIDQDKVTNILKRRSP